jgi:hypothetical protein
MLKLDGDLDSAQDDDFYFPIRRDNEHEYYYDIWSNIHYGYVGSAVGFDTRTLQSGHRNILAGTSDRTDVITVQIGIDLWRIYRFNLMQHHLHQAILAYRYHLSITPDDSAKVIPGVNWR